MMLLKQYNTELQHAKIQKSDHLSSHLKQYETEVLTVLTMKTMNLDCDVCLTFRTGTKQERYSLMLTDVHRFLRLKPK